MPVSMTAASAATLLTRPASCPGPLLRNSLATSYGNRSPREKKSTEWPRLYTSRGGGVGRSKPGQGNFAKLLRTPSVLGIFIVVYFVGCLSPAAFGPNITFKMSKRQEEKMHGGHALAPFAVEEGNGVVLPHAGGRSSSLRRHGRSYGIDGKSIDVFFREEGYKVPLHEALDWMLWADNSVALYSSDPLPSNPSIAWRREAERLRKWIADPERGIEISKGSEESTLRALQGSRKFQGHAVEVSEDVKVKQPSSIRCPKGPVRIFIGITSRCCTPSAIKKRHALRMSWVKKIQSEYGDSIRPVFLLSQPSSESDLSEEMLESLIKEATLYGDLAVVPGRERYTELPTKTLGLIGFALSSPCNYTHILKTDDDVYLRPHKLLQLIQKGERKYEFEIQNKQLSSSALTFDGKPPQNDSLSKTKKDVPWMRGVYIGKIDSNQTGVFPGWFPNRTVTSKWYLSKKILRDEDSPLGVRWASGWGYLMSRDVALQVWRSTIRNALLYSLTTDNGWKRPPYWGKLPWEDVLVAALLSDNQELESSGQKVSIKLSHHPGFKAAWDGCDEDTVLKHLDNDAPGLVAGLAAQDASKLWDKKEVICSTGPFIPNDYEGWRVWRNTLPDNIQNGFM